MGKASDMERGIQKVLGGVLFIGLSIQIVLGICWMAANFFGFQQFGESALYVEISKSLICDEYEGIIYPVLIMIARGIEDFFRIPYHYIIYLIQLAVAFGASYQMIKSVCIKEKWMLRWGSLAMLTFPMAMQCHLAILPDSLTSSVLLLELAWVFTLLRQDKEATLSQFAGGPALWLLAALMQPIYFYLGMVPILLVFLYGIGKTWKANKKRILYQGILIMCFGGMITGVEDLTQIDGYYGRVHQSLNASLVSRCAWLYVGNGYDFWPEEAKEHIPFGEAMQISYYADNVERILGKTLEEAVGVERAEELFGEVADIAWQHHKSRILHNTAWDIVGYSVSPIVLERQLDGKAYDSYSGRNYDIMRAKTPQLTEIYLHYGCWWFVAGLGIAGVMLLCRLTGARFRILLSAGRIIAVCSAVFTCILMAVLYSIRGAGMMDYKKSVTITVLWIFLMVITCVKTAHIKDRRQKR